MAALQILIGLIISKIEEVHDYIQVVFSDGTTLSIFNTYVYDGELVTGIEGRKVKSVEESADRVLIIFDNGKAISVGLKDGDYNGPEAMVLKQEGKSPVVWSQVNAAKGAGEFVDLTSSARRRHTLDGDATGGGHRPGTGKPGKSEFPAGRSDDNIIHDIYDIATDPTISSIAGRGGRTITNGTRNGVDIRVIQERNGDIVTGFPTNTPRNPR